jgi:hypothetical protein
MDLGICAREARQATGALNASLGWLSGRKSPNSHGHAAVSHRSQLT